jgi:hypothetical protein
MEWTAATCSRRAKHEASQESDCTRRRTPRRVGRKSRRVRQRTPRLAFGRRGAASASAGGPAFLRRHLSPARRGRLAAGHRGDVADAVSKYARLLSGDVACAAASVCRR